jgi:hypothetical protein
LENTPSPPVGRGGISADVIWGKKCEKRKRKWEKLGEKGEKGEKVKEKGRKGKE